MSDIEVTMATGYIPISRELGIEMGVVEPTPAERAELERQAWVAKLAAAERKARMQIFRQRLRSITEQPARDVLFLHSEDTHGRCMGDEFGGYDGDAPDWPCGTVETIAKHYGIELP